MAWSNEARRESARVRHLKALLKKRVKPWKPEMSIAEAKAWVKGSAYTKTVARIGSSRNAVKARKEGFIPVDDQFAPLYGPGMYFATGPEGLAYDGDAVNSFKVKLRNPLKVHLTAADSREMEKKKSFGLAMAMDFRKHAYRAAGVAEEDIEHVKSPLYWAVFSGSGFIKTLKDRGYDGIVFTTDEGIKFPVPQLVAFDREQIVMLRGAEQKIGYAHLATRKAAFRRAFRVGM